ncbi:hypothetical protein [Natronobacterium texcoconense]|uniref:hypothetical protein n=1 Tax=Natronobacterium texcoconense TaxID=1095778 RepID=UPI00147D19E0|nr:hypothetical protein [Natronobacterium texcoconense]
MNASIGNLYVFPDLFPILVWPPTIATLIVVSLLTYESHQQYADERTVVTE